jgi:hypothetical protein
MDIEANIGNPNFSEETTQISIAWHNAHGDE